jgi:hypothetical protein
MIAGHSHSPMLMIRFGMLWLTQGTGMPLTFTRRKCLPDVIVFRYRTI